MRVSWGILGPLGLVAVLAAELGEVVGDDLGDADGDDDTDDGADDERAGVAEVLPFDGERACQRRNKPNAMRATAMATRTGAQRTRGDGAAVAGAA